MFKKLLSFLYKNKNNNTCDNVIEIEKCKNIKINKVTINKITIKNK